MKYLIMDVDGTLTDGKLYIGNDGEMFKAFSVKDGYGIYDILPKHGIVPIIITARESEIVKRRCEELNILHIYQGCRNKTDKLIELAQKFEKKVVKGKIEDFAYIGDDIIDCECVKICEKSGCPADSCSEVKESCQFVSQYKGGEGAVREFIEWLINNKFVS